MNTGSRILAFGDSLTLGVGAGKDQSYPAVLSQLTGLEVINSGVSGETTDEGLLRFEQELTRVQPSLVILMEGGNDILRNQNLDVTKSNLAAMISVARDRNVPVILIGIPEKRLFSNAAPLYEELAKENGVVFDGTLVAGLLRTPAYKSDPIHLNEQGYRALAEAIYDLLEDKGALMKPRISMITLGVKDVQAAAEFYEKGLGFPRIESEPTVAFFNLNGSWLGLYGRDALAEDANVAAGGKGFDGFTLAHNVHSEAEVDEVFDTAIEAGAKAVKKPLKVFWGGYSGYFADPDGHLWEVAHNPHLWIGPRDDA